MLVFVSILIAPVDIHEENNFPLSPLGPTKLPMQWVLEILSPEAKQPGRETDHPPTSIAEVKYSGADQIIAMGCGDKSC
jgi:hypothetical protein